MHFVEGQTLLTNYFSLLESIDKVLSQKDDLINSLSSYCKELIQDRKGMIEDRRQNMSHLLKILYDTAQRNCGRRKDKEGPRNGNRYDEENHRFGAYTFLTAGRMFYQMLQANMPDSLPSISSVEKYVARNSHLMPEGVFFFKECKEFLLSRNLPLHVGLSEDGTNMKPNFKYNRKTNLVVGPVLPLVNGLPDPNAFPATSAALIAKHYLTNSLAKIAYVVMVQPLVKSAPPFVLAIFGTNNSFTAEDVAKRRIFTVNGLATQGISVVYWAADGDARVLKDQRAEMFGSNPTVPEGFESWYFADISDGPTPIQDPIHLANRYKTRMLKYSIIMAMGKYVVSAAHLKILIKNVSKAEHGLTEHDLNKKDKMNFTATMKICSERTCKALEKHVPGCEATLVYLDLMRKFISAFLDPSLSPLQRVYNIWYCLRFIRKWRNWVLSSKKYNINDNFLTSNMQAGTEMDGHGLVKIMFYLRDKKLDHLFVPSLFGSQTNESFFRKARSTATTESLKINFDMLELLHQVKRKEFLLEVSAKLSKVLEMPREKRVVLLSDQNEGEIRREPLPWNEEIKGAVMSAFQDAADTAQRLGMVVNANLSTKLGTILSLDVQSDEEEEDDIMEAVEEEDLDDDIPLDILRAFSSATPSSLDLSDVSSANLTPEQELSPTSPYVCFKDAKGVVRVLQKITFCWLIHTEGFYISNDRLERCKTQVAAPRRKLLSQPKVCEVGNSNEVSVGDFCIFKKGSKLVIVQLLGFQFLTGRSKMCSQDTVPTKAPTQGARGLGFLCTVFKVNGSVIVETGFDFLNLKSYVVSIPSPVPARDCSLHVCNAVLQYLK